MDENKICFIWNVRNESYYQESVKYVDNLIVPNGISVEKVAVSDKNFAKAYNLAMKKTDAKYKVYLYDSLFLLNKSFIADMLNIFKNSEVALLGVLGSRVIPTNGVWQDSRNKIGKQYLDNGQKVSLVSFGNAIEEKYVEVKALEGSILITQKDISWREDLFEEKYFFESAQCIEFIKQGYKVGVVNQIEPWSLIELTENENKEQFDKAANLFLENYSKDIFPLVSILIPTYNRPEYFKIALESAINQTYKNIEIIVGDDSTDYKTSKLIKPYLNKYKNIIYLNNNGPMGDYGYNNLQNIVKRARGQFINILMDDDIFHINKINSMMNYYLEYEDQNITLVTSYRQLIDENGAFLEDKVATQKLFDKTTIVDGKELGRFVLFNFLNIIGEPTTVLLRKKDINTLYGMYGKKEHKCLVDIAQWLELLSKGKAVYISDTLSYFRQHAGQNQKNEFLMLRGAIDNYQYINTSYYCKYFIYNEQEYLKIIEIWLNANKHYVVEKNRLQLDKNYSQNDFNVFLSYINEAQEKMMRNSCSSSI